jgi:hypothetical protein
MEENQYEQRIELICGQKTLKDRHGRLKALHAKGWLRNSSLAGADLSCADLGRAHLKKGDLHNIHLCHTNLVPDHYDSWG